MSSITIEPIPDKFGKEGVEAFQGYEPMTPAIPAPRENAVDGPEYETHREDLLKGAKEILDRREAADLAGEKPIIPRAYKETNGEHAGEPMPENQTLSVEQASWDITGARSREEHQTKLSEEAELARLIDDARNGVTSEQLQAEPQPVQQPQPMQDAAQPSPHERMAKALSENPEIMSGLQEAIQQERARAEFAFNKYADGLIQNGHVAAAALVSNFPELQNPQPHEIGTAIQVIGQRDPQRGQQILNFIDRIAPLVDQAAQVQQQRQQYQAAQYQAAWSRDAVQSDQAYDRWARSQGVSHGGQEQIKQEVLADFKRQGWSMEQIGHAYNTNAAMRSFADQVQLYQAAAYRLQQQKMANVRRNKLDRTAPPVQRPGSPEARIPDGDIHLGKLEAKLDREMSPKAAAELVVARRAARRR
jgi:hypothetical protein